MIDSRDIKELHPTLQRAAVELARRLKAKGYTIGFITYRDKEMQDKLYNQPKNGLPFVTGLRGGKSMHNYRLAFDIFNNVKGDMYPKALFALVGDMAKDLGLLWGGTWTGKNCDKPHFQWTGEFTQAQICQGKVPKDVKLKWEKQPTEIEDIKNLLSLLDSKKKPYDGSYWLRVVKGEIKADPKFLDVLIKRSLE